MKAKILIDNPAGRFKAGEVGDLLQNDSVKYDYYLKLPGTHRLKHFLSIPGITISVRQYYFYENEVELLNENVD